jgi:hypothetical protein
MYMNSKKKKISKLLTSHTLLPKCVRVLEAKGTRYEKKNYLIHLFDEFFDIFAQVFLQGGRIGPDFVRQLRYICRQFVNLWNKVENGVRNGAEG